MERHNSCINTKAVIDFVEAHDPSLIDPLLDSVKSIFPEVEDLKTFLSDPNNWVSTEVLISLYNQAKLLFGKDDIVYDIGYESVAKRRLGYIQRILFFQYRHLRRIIERLQHLNDKFNRNKNIEIVDRKKDGVIVRLKWFQDLPLTSDFCLMNKGVYSAVPVIWKDPPCEVREQKCYFKGDEYCEYDITWQHPPSIKRMLGRIFTPWRLAKASIEELERDKTLLKEKYTEVHQLNIQLESQLNRLISFHQTGTAILSTLDRNELMESILTQLVEVSSLDRAAIFLLDEKSKTLYLAHAKGSLKNELDEVRNYTVPLEKQANIIARVARTGIPELVDDVNKYPINLTNRLVQVFKPKGFVVYPLVAREEVIGVLVGDQNSAGSLAITEEKDFLSSFSNQIAIALSNVNLYRQLERSEKKYRELVENAHEGIWVVNEGGVITFSNERLATMLGYKEIVGENIARLVPREKETVLVDILQQNRYGKVVQEEIQMVHQDQSPVFTIISSVPIIEDGTYQGSFATITDITEKKELEARILHQQKMDSIGTMASGIAHDFNNVLTMILESGSLLKQQLAPEDKLNRYVDIIETSGLRAADIVRQLMAFSKNTEPDGAQVFFLNRIIHEILNLLKSSLGEDVLLDLDLAPELPAIKGNASQVQQALVNLCLNARDAMLDGGRLTISTALIDLKKKENIRYRQAISGHHRYLRLSIRDNGTGIADDFLDRIFDPFFTTKPVGKGSGLGLAMVYAIVKNCDGHVFVESKRGEGTVFDLIFPATTEEVRLEVADPPHSTLGGTETVLIADDEDLVRDLGSEILTLYGYQVLLAKNGREALKIYKENQSQIDLVILDLIMPGLNGAETLKRIRQIDPGMKAVLCSGYGGKGGLMKSLGDFPPPLVSKPFRITDLVSTVRQVLDNDVMPPDVKAYDKKA